MPIVNKSSPARPWLKKRKPFERSKDKANRDVYDSPKWKALRWAVRLDEPLCRACLDAGLAVDTYVIDHVRPINQGGAAFDRANLQGLCRACHEVKSRSETNSRIKQDSWLAEDRR